MVAVSEEWIAISILRLVEMVNHLFLQLIYKGTFIIGVCVDNYMTGF